MMKSNGAESHSSTSNIAQCQGQLLQDRRRENQEAPSKEKHREKSLYGYVPGLYSAVLEGTLLANGDLKGFWRLKHGDSAKNEFCMVLEDRGVYNGGFNIRKSGGDPSSSLIEEIHDKWYTVDWRATTSCVSNVWGRGRNPKCGEYCLLGSHTPHRRAITLYKVEEAEILKAEEHIAQHSSVASSDPPRSSSLAGEGDVTRVKRRRSHASTEVGTRTIATARAQAASGGAHAGEGACSGNGAVPPASAAHRSTDDNGSSANARENDAQIAEGCSPPTPSEASKANSGAQSESPPAPDGPSLSDAMVRENAVGGTERWDDMVDVTTFATRVKQEKAKIAADAIAHKKELEETRDRIHSRLSKARQEEYSLVRSLQDLRQTMMKEEKELQETGHQLQCAEVARKGALKWWDDKWDTHVAPFIARREQDVKKKAEEVERTTREAEKAKFELQQELQRLHSVKMIASEDIVSSEIGQ